MLSSDSGGREGNVHSPNVAQYANITKTSAEQNMTNHIISYRPNMQ